MLRKAQATWEYSEEQLCQGLGRLSKGGVVWARPVKKEERVSCSVMSDSVTPWTVARQAPLSMEFSRQEHWDG